MKTQNLLRAAETAQQSAQENVTKEVATATINQPATEAAPKKTRGRRPKAEQLSAPAQQVPDEPKSARGLTASGKRGGCVRTQTTYHKKGAETCLGPSD